MKFLSLFLCMTFGAAVSRTVPYVYKPSEKLPKDPVWTKCGLMSNSSIDDVRELFSNFRKSVKTATEKFKNLRIPSASINPLDKSDPTTHSNLDPYYTAMKDSDCWLLSFDLSVRIYLDAKMLRKFVDPLINISITEFKKGLSQGGNSSNMGLAVATVVDELIKGISRLDCVIEATNISIRNPNDIPSPPMQRRPEPTTDEELMQMMGLQLRDTGTAVERAHRDLRIMLGTETLFPSGGSEKCTKRV